MKRPPASGGLGPKFDPRFLEREHKIGPLTIRPDGRDRITIDLHHYGRLVSINPQLAELLALALLEALGEAAL